METLTADHRQCKQWIVVPIIRFQRTFFRAVFRKHVDGSGDVGLEKSTELWGGMRWRRWRECIHHDGDDGVNVSTMMATMA